MSREAVCFVGYCVGLNRLGWVAGYTDMANLSLNGLPFYDALHRLLIEMLVTRLFLWRILMIQIIVISITLALLRTWRVRSGRDENEDFQCDDCCISLRS
jgi:hypothetical protein